VTDNFDSNEGYVATPSSRKSIDDHLYDDLDTSPDAHHHTLGLSPNQAASYALLKKLFAPVGKIEAFATLTVPTGFLACDGSAVSRDTYAELYEAIGDSWGAGDGVTTFNVPNLLGRVLVGYDPAQPEFDVLGETGGAKTHTLTVGELPSHAHTGSTGSAANQSVDHTHAIDHDHASFDVTDSGAAITANFNNSSNATVPSPAVIQAGTTGSPTSATISGTGGSGAHTHAIDVPALTGTSGNQSASHNHAITVNVAAQGGGGAHNNLQPYGTVYYAIRAL
jgi:microcystin-dependent protein